MEASFPSASENDDELLADGDNLGPQESLPNTYDAFMKKHLQHYGYYTGQNAAYRENFRSLQEWKKNYDVRLSGQHDLSMVEEHFGRSGPFPKFLDMPSVFSTDGTLSDELLHRTTQLVFHYQAGRKIPKLREPRNLYALTKEAGPQQATRWPSHIQVVSPAIRFIDYTPPTPDPLYEKTGHEPTPSVRGPQMGEMIFYNDPGRDLYFMRSRVAGCRLAMRTTPPPREYPDDNLTLEFESRFESGNLLKADKLNDFEYELTLRTDLYTTKHTQWFFFRVRNMRPGKNYRFTIINLMKPSSLYNQGMKPVFYSEINAKKNKIGWIRKGSNIRYYRNNMCGRDGRSYYSLSWTSDFPYKDDCCYFAHCYPYTYSDLQEYLLQLANDPVRSRFCKQRVLTRTLAGNLVYILTITSPSRNPEISRSKRAVVITARVHPGETNASWMMKGFLDYLTSSSADAKLLRDTFIFKIVPMLNPDGVIVGNYRCSLAGRDLNRNYKSVLKDSFPSIWHTKMMVKRLNSERQVLVYCDLHGHSRKNNIFIYGCENKHDRSKRLQERVFPLMLSKNASQSFSFESCKYKVQKSKEGTGRIVVWYLGVMNSYTMEATFGGTSLPGKRKNTHLSTKDLEMMGYHFCDTLLDYCDPDSSKIHACMRELQNQMKQKILRRLQLQNPDIRDVNLDDYASDFESDTSGSDSSCDDGLPVHLLAIAPKLQRKKKLRNRRDKLKASGSKPSSNLTGSEKTQNNSQKNFPDKAKPLRYSQNVSNGKRKEERQTAATTIVGAVPNDSQRSAEKSSKKLPVVSLSCIDPLLGLLLATRAGYFFRTTEYLEALTSAYMRSGVLVGTDSVKDYSLRYTNNNNTNGRSTQDGNFAVKYLSNHLDNSSDSDVETKRDSPIMCNASCQWSPQPDTPASSGTEDEEAVNKDAILAEEQYEILRQSALRRQLSADQQRMLAKKHLIAVAAKQQKRNEDSQRIGSARSCFDLASRHSNSNDPTRIPTPESVLIVSSGTIQSEQTPSKIALIAPSGRPKSSSLVRAGTSSYSMQSKPQKPIESSHDKTSDHVDEEQNKVVKSQDEYKAASERISESLSSSLPQSESIESSRRQQPSASPPRLESTLNQDQQAVNKMKHFFTTSKPDQTQPNQKRLQSEANLYQNVNDAPLKISSTDTPRSVNSINSSSKKQDDGKEFHLDTDFDLSPRARNKANFQKTPFDEDLSLGNSIAPLPGISSDESLVPAVTNQSLLNLARPSAPRNVHQPDTKCMVKGEILLPKSMDKPVIPSGMKKPNSVLMEPETDTLTVQSSRSYKSNNLDVNQKLKSKQSNEDSFFGMSDRIGPSVIPRNTRVPAVVANIAELRRSLLGHGREGSEPTGSKSDSPRKVLSNTSVNMRANPEGIFHSDDAMSFTKRTRRRNANLLQNVRKDGSSTDRGFSFKLSKNETEMTSDRDSSNPRNTETKSPNDNIDDILDENIDSMSTVVSYDDHRRKHSHRRHQTNNHENSTRDQNRDLSLSHDLEPLSYDQSLRGVQHQSRSNREHNRHDQRHVRQRDDHKKHETSLQVEEEKNDADSPVRPSKSESDSRRYTQGNTTIEKQSDSSMTNIRIGSRTTGRATFSDHLFDSYVRPEGPSSGGRSELRHHSVSAVSLNMKGDEERMCVTTPALASRPVPPLLRYLSAKQGMNKRK